MINIKYATMVELNRIKNIGSLNENYNLKEKNELKEFGKKSIEYLSLKEVFFNLQKQEKLTNEELDFLIKTGKYLNDLQKKLSKNIEVKEIDFFKSKSKSTNKIIYAEQNITRELLLNVSEFLFNPSKEEYLNKIYKNGPFLSKNFYELFNDNLKSVMGNHQFDYKYFLNYSFKLYDILKQVYTENGISGIQKFQIINEELLNNEFVDLISCLYSNKEIKENDSFFDKYSGDFSKFKDSIILNITSENSSLKNINMKNLCCVLQTFFFAAENYTTLFENGNNNTHKIKETAIFKDLTEFIAIINRKTDIQTDPNNIQKYISNVAYGKIQLPQNKGYIKKI